MADIYDRVASRFRDYIGAVFQSDQTLENEWKRNFESIPFDRTSHWQTILYRALRACWLEAGPEVKAEPTTYDRQMVLRALHPTLDYNLFTQVLLNLQTYNGMTYQVADAEKERETLREAWKDRHPSPFDPGARMHHIVTPADHEYNVALSTLRSLETVTAFTPMISFRVSPIGRTPAFADSNNISMLGMGADRFLRILPILEAYYLTWKIAPRVTRIHGPSPESKSMIIQAEGIQYPFESKSGGEILNEVLFARKLAYEVYGALEGKVSMLTILPRMNSLMVVTDKVNERVRELLHKIQGQYGLTVALGSRTNIVVQNTKTTVLTPDDVIEICAKYAGDPISAARVRALKGTLEWEKSNGAV